VFLYRNTWYPPSRGWPCRAFVGWRLLSGKVMDHACWLVKLVAADRETTQITDDCRTVDSVEPNKSHSRLETRQLTALVVADSSLRH
jgi:hypothetical protein